MLFLDPSIVLSPEAGSLACPIFLWDSAITAVAADHEDANYPAANVLNPQTSSLWKSGVVADQSLLFDIGNDDPINAAGIARHNFGSAQIGLKIYGITAEPGAVFVLLADLAPGDDTAILAVFDDDYYVQLRFDLDVGAVAPQAAVVYAGSALLMPRGTPAGYVLLKDALERDMLTGTAENGDFLGDVVTAERFVTTVEFKLLDGDWYRENMRPFVQSRAPFFYARAPLTMPDEMGFIKFSGVPKGQVNQFTGEVDVSLSMTGLAL